ncbi:hypothetical protein ABZO31_27655 [Streptomyces sp. HUAS MG47]|uniref:hypothetical protein n=1 Tax=Streptomyces solicamelliae TaxID=3231716 RepID=UPI0038781730
MPMLVMIDGSALPAVHCSHACADYRWLERMLADAPATPETAAALEVLDDLRRLLDARREPSDIGPLLGGA